MIENKKLEDFINRTKNKKPIEIIGLFVSERENLLKNTTKYDKEELINKLLSNMNETDIEKAKNIFKLLIEKND